MADDLKYAIGLEVDDSKVVEALKKTGHDIDALGKEKTLELEFKSLKEYLQYVNPGGLALGAGLLGAQYAAYGVGNVAKAAVGASSPVGFFGNVAGGLHSAGSANPLGFAADLAGPAIHQFGELLGKLPYVGQVIGPLVQHFAALPAIFKDITSSLISFASVASPGSFRAYMMAIEDLQGVIGGSFLPVLNLMRDGIRLIGDVMATILPNFDETSAALSDVRSWFAQLSAELRTAIGEVGPEIRGEFIFMIRYIGEAIKEVVPSGRELADVIRGVVKLTSALIQLSYWVLKLTGVIDFFSGILRLIAEIGRTPFGGETRVGARGVRSSTGAAAQPANMQDVESYQRQIQIAAYSERGTSQEQVPDLVAQIAADVHLIASLPGRAGSVVGGIGYSLGGGPVIDAIRWGLRYWRGEGNNTRGLFGNA